MKKRMIAFASLCLTMAMLLSACSMPGWVSSMLGIETGRRLENYASMRYKRPDVDAMKQALEDQAAAIRAAGSFDDMLDSFSEDSLWEDFNTMYVLAMLKTYQFVNDAYYDEEYRYLEEQGVELEVLNADVYLAVLESPYANEYRDYVGDYFYQYMVNTTLLYAPETQELQQKRADLAIDYKDMLDNLTLDINGTPMTMDDIYMVDSYELFAELYTLFYKQSAEEFAALYAELIALDNETARLLGFDSAADMYYMSYNRDYGPEEALGYAALVKEYLVPLVPAVMAGSSDNTRLDLRETMQGIPSILRRVSPELEEAWDDMLAYDLYDFEAREDKMSGIGFTTYIAAYDAPFAYTYWNGNSSSATTILHEFGHFYDNWLRYDEVVISNLDVAECYSQGLEVLAQNYLKDITPRPDAAIKSNLGGLLQAITYQMLLEELQLAAYELDEVNATTVGGLYTQLLDEYGYGDYILGDEDGIDHGWFEITHLFDVPFYTVSYTTSAGVALQLWSVAQADWNEAADIYLEMIHADQNRPFLQLLERAGLQSPFEGAVVKEIAANYTAVFGIGGGGTAQDEAAQDERPQDDGERDEAA